MLLVFFFVFAKIVRRIPQYIKCLFVWTEENGDEKKLQRICWQMDDSDSSYTVAQFFLGTYNKAGPTRSNISRISQRYSLFSARA